MITIFVYINERIRKRMIVFTIYKNMFKILL